MSTADNIDRFNRIALLTLELLYSSFPVPVDIEVSKLAKDTLPTDVSFDGTWDSIQAAYHTVEFLQQEGFIQPTAYQSDANRVLHARLTMKGLAVLGMPSSLQHKEPLINEVRSTIKGGVRQASSEAVKQVAQMLFSAGISAVQNMTNG
jgi:ribosomal protein S8